MPGKNLFTNYLSLVKFSHTIFAMPFAFVGYFYAVRVDGGEFSWKLLVLIVLCMIFARNAAMAFNRYVDREIDLRNPRTALRELPAGIIRPLSALQFVIVNSLAFIITTAFINQITLRLSPVALFVILGYSLTKKFTSFCHFILGIGLSLAPIGAYLSVKGEFAVVPVLFSFAVLFWVSGFDIMYALQDEEFDKQERLHSMPVRLGTLNSLILSAILHFASATLIVIAGLMANFGLLYWIGTFFYIGLLVYQHVIVKPKNLSRINEAFALSNGFASVIFAIFSIADMFWRI
jgi:4-hydroxybenzoate polyprenyltransferase